ncbi:Hsp20/alpha crystallin family protein [Neolewinella xylanilytica]|nr:Hsp20/alpha crystallin family protein [Neolewinella xylanilytica]
MSSFFPNMARFASPHGPVGDWRMQIAFPPVNIAREEEAFVVSLAVPGYDKSDFTISATNGMLTVSAEHGESLEEQTDDYLHREYARQSFERQLTLPADTIEEAITATYDKGILVITVPRRADATDVKTIEVTVD